MSKIAMRPVAATHVWCTPPELVGKLGNFDLDPCACAQRLLPNVKRHYFESDDGLALPWKGRVWLNPPYGREGVFWLRHLRDHGNGIALYPCRTETNMFYETVWGKAHGVLFLRGRPHFLRPDGSVPPGNTGAASCLIAYGQSNLETLKKSGLGVVVTECR